MPESCCTFMGDDPAVFGGSWLPQCQSALAVHVIDRLMNIQSQFYGETIGYDTIDSYRLQAEIQQNYWALLSLIAQEQIYQIYNFQLMPLNNPQPSLSCLNICTGSEPSKNKHVPTQASQGTKKYKTEMCKNFAMKGFCPYRKKCRFAHGVQDLQETTHSTLFRTKNCKNFWEQGHCPYASRCQFSHSARPNRQTHNYLHIVEMAIDSASPIGESRLLSFLSSAR